jgi:hypothetical protein
MGKKWIIPFKCFKIEMDSPGFFLVNRYMENRKNTTEAILKYFLYFKISLVYFQSFAVSAI